MGPRLVDGQRCRCHGLSECLVRPLRGALTGARLRLCAHKNKDAVKSHKTCIKTEMTWQQVGRKLCKASGKGGAPAELRR